MLAMPTQASWTEADDFANVAVHAGEVVRIASVPAHAIKLLVFPVAAADTETRRHDRWRVRPSLADALPAELSGLASGHQTG